MPIVGIVDGVKLTVYHDEHPPPHFHAKFAEHLAVIELDGLTVIEGSLPRSKLKAVIDWATPRKAALIRAFYEAQAKRKPGRIP